MIHGEDDFRKEFDTKKEAEDYLKDSTYRQMADFVSLSKEDADGMKEHVKSKYEKFN